MENSTLSILTLPLFADIFTSLVNVILLNVAFSKSAATTTSPPASTAALKSANVETSTAFSLKPPINNRQRIKVIFCFIIIIF